MSADNRSVHTDALATLGTIIGDGEARDAIHLAVEPVVAAERLKAGQDVGLLANGTASAKAAKLLGIVDPFLKEAVMPGARFWLVVYPRQITSLRHVWVHPDFASTPDLPSPSLDPRAFSRAWIEEYAESLGGEDWDDDYKTVNADELIDHAKTWVDPTSKWGGDYLVKGGLLEGVRLNDEFWTHFEIVTGLKAPHDRPSFFSCSC